MILKLRDDILGYSIFIVIVNRNYYKYILYEDKLVKQKTTEGTNSLYCLRRKRYVQNKCSLSTECKDYVLNSSQAHGLTESVTAHLNVNTTACFEALDRKLLNGYSASQIGKHHRYTSEVGRAFTSNHNNNHQSSRKMIK